MTDGVKRALRNFGNLLGLCLYEKSYAQEVIKIKPQPVVCDVHQLCAYIYHITDYACHLLSQSLTSLIYTVGRDLLAFRHLLVAHMMSHRARLPSHLMSLVLSRPQYVQLSPGPVLFKIQLWTLRHLVSHLGTNKGSLVVRERERTPLVYVLARQGNK